MEQNNQTTGYGLVNEDNRLWRFNKWRNGTTGRDEYWFSRDPEHPVYCAPDEKTASLAMEINTPASLSSELIPRHWGEQSTARVVPIQEVDGVWMLAT